MLGCFDRRLYVLSSQSVEVNSTSRQDSRSRLRRRWWFANATVLTIAFVFFSLIGHGITGPHGDELTLSQNIAHTIGLIVVGLMVFPAQRLALKPWIGVSFPRILIATLLFTGVFQFGAKVYRPPADWILGFTVLGTAAWIRIQGFKGRRLVWTFASIVAFSMGMVLAAPIVFTAIRAGLFDPDSPSLLDHTLTWVLGAGMTGIIGGYTSGWPLSRLLVSAR